MKYTVKSGDTIFKLAVLFYYNWDLWPLIYYYNEDIIGDDPLQLQHGITLDIPVPFVTDVTHIGIEGDTSIKLSKKYYGISHYHREIEEANNWPDEIIAGNSYKIPALCSKIEIDAVAELRRDTHVEFNR
ncbi:MAG: LysM peptidoglycan-binding domain-containing protein [Leptospirales bacterium]|nr:LysM peptidoglycan-binding domain-containing protein [Leptospirales bacterium]